MRDFLKFGTSASFTRSRALALSFISLAAISVAPTTAAETDATVEMGHVLGVIPDLSQTQLADLRSRFDKLSSGRADKSIITEFMRQNSGELVARYDADDKLIDSRSELESGHGKEIMGKLPALLQRCKTEQREEAQVMRASFSWGSASVYCNAFEWSKSGLNKKSKVLKPL